MDEHDVTVSIVTACANAGALDAAADALRVAHRIVAMFELPDGETDDVDTGNIRLDALLAVRAAVMGEPDPITRYGINMRVPDDPALATESGRIHSRVAHMLNQTRAWVPL